MSRRKDFNLLIKYIWRVILGEEIKEFLNKGGGEGIYCCLIRW